MFNCEVRDSFVLLAYASLAYSITFCNNTSLFGLSFKLRRFILHGQTKKWLLWTMTAAQADENHGDEWDLIWCVQWEINISIPTWV